MSVNTATDPLTGGRRLTTTRLGIAFETRYMPVSDDSLLRRMFCKTAVAFGGAGVRTRHNNCILPTMAATLKRDGSTVYGSSVDSVEAGDELILSTATIPQVTPHEGYGTAFREMDDVSMTL